MMDSNYYNVGLGSNMSEQGDSSSAEEVESPRSVKSPRSVVTDAVLGRRRRSGRGRGQKNYGLDRYMFSNSNNNKGDDNNKCYLHIQVLRIKEEELQIGEYLMSEFGICNVNYVPVDEVWSRTVLPASPLGTKNNNY